MERAEHEREGRFRQTYAESYGRVHAYLRRRLGADVADELTAEVFLVAWRRFDAIPADPLPWLYGVARNVAHRYRTAQAREQSTRHALNAERTPRTPNESSDGPLWGAWEQLSSADREVLSLIAWEELTVQEAARAIGCSAPVFSVRLFRARKRLERLLDRSAAGRDPVSNLSEAR